MHVFQGKVQAYGIVVASVIGIFLADLALGVLLGQGAPIMALLLPVIVAAMFGGILSGFLATAIGAIMAATLFIPTAPAFSVLQPDWIRLGLFLASGSLVSWLVGSRARALTEARRAFDELQEREERYQLVLAGTQSAIWDWDVPRKRVVFSPRWKQLRGFSDADVSDREDEWAKGIHPDDVNRVMDAVEAHFSGETSIFSAEYRVRHKDGHWIWIMDHGIARRDSDGRVIRMAGSETDITERKEAERALQASEQRLRRAIEEAPFPVLVHAEDGEILQVSRALTQITGYRKDELKTIGEWTERAYGERKAWAQSEIDRLYQLDEAVDEGEYRIRTAEGDERIWEFASSPLGLGDSGRRLVISMAADVTDRKRAEDAVREADRRKDEFLAVLAHELRNPLAPLRTGLELLGSRAMPDHVTKVRTMMERQVIHLTRLVDDLLDMSRISRGDMKLKRAFVDLNDVINSAIELAMPGITQRQHKLIDERQDTPLLINGDEERLVQVVSNVLSNAVKYMEPGGTIWLRAEAVQARAVLEIKDTGFGIPPEQLEDVFDMFSQVPQHRSATGGGDLGIGLALSRQVINLHGGSIEAKSDGLGLGSKFIMRLPLQQQVAVKNFSKEVGVQNCGSQRILIVDDNRDAAESMSALLELKGHTVQTAYDGVEAIKAVEVFAPEVVLLDIGLPNMDGYEVARRIRTMRNGKEVLLFALTGWGQESDKEQTRAAGFDEHLTKPVNAALISTLITAQARRRHRPGDSVDDMSALN